MLALSINGYEIFDNNKINLIQEAVFFVSESENAYKILYEKYLSSITESGIEQQQKDAIMEISVRKYLTEYRNKYSNIDYTGAYINVNLSDIALGYYVSQWLNTGCFMYYVKEKCDLKKSSNLETSVLLDDLLAVWVIFIQLLAATILAFIYELAEAELSIFESCTLNWQ